MEPVFLPRQDCSSWDRQKYRWMFILHSVEGKKMEAEEEEEEEVVRCRMSE